MPSADTPTETKNRLSERARQVPPSGIRRFFEIAATMDDVISLGIGEPDFVSPQPVMDAAKASLDEGRTGYTSNSGIKKLRHLIAEDIDERHGVSYDAEEQVLVTVGVSEAMQLAMLALLDPGDEILIPEPCFVSYGPTASFAGADVSYVPTSSENDFAVTAEAIAERVTPRTKALMLGYPNNPTGAVLAREEAERIAEVVVENDLLLISDEIYDRLIYGDARERGHVCLPSVEGLKERTVLLGGFSKNYAMTGWRIGYACAPRDVFGALYKLHQYIVMSAPTMGQVGAMAAIEESQDAVEEMRASYDERRRVIVEGLREAGLPTFEPEGAFYAFPDIRPTGLSSEEFAQQLLKEEHVACVPGDAFGPSGEGFVRCSYATGLDDIREAVERIGRFVDQV
ncbi:MAG: aromatic amino acid aminotransferase [Bacteroidetes bacterium QS_8_64_10]|jgi:aminotransferase|nr:MAG: aromatic amino acid aminotransferase [Bacteroidetes bacterium QS_8_64_10]